MAREPQATPQAFPRLSLQGLCTLGKPRARGGAEERAPCSSPRAQNPTMSLRGCNPQHTSDPLAAGLPQHLALLFLLLLVGRSARQGQQRSIPAGAQRAEESRAAQLWLPGPCALRSHVQNSPAPKGNRTSCVRRECAIKPSDRIGPKQTPG